MFPSVGRDGGPSHDINNTPIVCYLLLASPPKHLQAHTPLALSITSYLSSLNLGPRASTPLDHLLLVMSAILRKTVRTIKHLPRRFSRAPGKDDLDSQREEVLSKLWVTYKATRAMDLDQVLMDPEQLARLSILTLPLDLTGDTDTNRVVPPALNPASYFVPLTDDYIREHPVDLSDSVTAEWFNDKAKALDPEFRGFGNEPMSSYDAADQLSRCLHIEMSSSRLNCEEETQKLTWLNKWRVT